MFGNISGMVLNMPRILYAAARDGVLPSRSVAAIHPVFRTPYVAVIIYSALGFIFASIGEFRQLAILSSASYLLIYLGVVFSVIRYRISGERREGSYRIPGGYLIPALSALSILWVLSNLPKNELIGMGIFITVVTVVYFVIALAGRQPKRSEG
jgi:amino acid transporter